MTPILNRCRVHEALMLLDERKAFIAALQEADAELDEAALRGKKEVAA